MSWEPAPAIESLQRDLDKAFPHRTEPDWIIGDADHSSRESDHNPDAKGMVHAIDVRLGGGLDVRQVLNAVIGDSRVWYVIHNGIIYSRTYGWAARKYMGASAHTEHIHISIRYTRRAEQDTTSWDIRPAKPAAKPATKPKVTPPKPKVVPAFIDLSVVKDEFLKALDLRDGKVKKQVSVSRLQRALNARTGTHLKPDGLVGKSTIAAWQKWEKKIGESGRPRVPDSVSLARLVQPRWRMIA